MAKKERTGQRVLRKSRKTIQVHDAYYLIVTDAEETEINYFDGLQKSLLPQYKDKVTIKTIKTETKYLIKEGKSIQEYEAQYKSVWIVFDRDRVTKFDEIIQTAKENDFEVGWSNPCFEMWLFCYLNKMPNIPESDRCWKKFGEEFQKRTHKEYKKDDKDIYKHVNEIGNEKQAIKKAQQRMNQWARDGETKPSRMCPGTTVFKLIR